MTRKKTPATPTPRKNIPCYCDDPTDPDQAGGAYAKVLTSPAVAAYRVIQAAQPESLQAGIDTPTMLSVLMKHAEAVKGGDLSQAESMLINQASALQSLFTHLTERGLAQSHMPNLEAFMRLALRAQSQCRATLETLATIKNPPIVYARQANVTTGPQQINNVTGAREIDTEQNKLLEADHGQRMDTRAARAASGVDTALEAMGAIERAKVTRG